MPLHGLGKEAEGNYAYFIQVGVKVGGFILCCCAGLNQRFCAVRTTFICIHNDAEYVYLI